MDVIDLTHLYADSPYPARDESIITDFIVHHTETGAPLDLDNAIDIIRAIHEFHRDIRGWPGVAYHRFAWEQYYFLVRPRARNGWHTGGMDIEPRNGIGDGNDKGMACAIIGTHTHIAPSQRTLQTLAEGKEWEERQLGRSISISGHQDWSPTACPGEGWKFWRYDIRTVGHVEPSPCEGLITALAHISDIVVHDRLTAELDRVRSKPGVNLRRSVVQSVVDDTKAIREQFIGARP